jgi:hypothetical protein
MDLFKLHKPIYIYICALIKKIDIFEHNIQKLLLEYNILC